MYFVRPPYLIKKYYHECIWRMPEGNRMYLTFDDGPTPIVTEWVLELLASRNIKGTFFCLGKSVVGNTSLFNRISEEGYAIGNHTYDHLAGWNTKNDEYFSDIEKARKLIPSKLFRPPYGKITKRQLNTLRKEYKIVLWDVLSGDFDVNISEEKCVNNVIKNARDGSIIVFHDTQKAFKNLKYCLPRVIDHFMNQGIIFEKLLEEKPEKVEP
ncbi:MAG: polysaccharide deacetylase family protein [Bacteroidetes bacterium]|nr:polysaccharide deacetylase family protein [Bacteroidota bacterium]